jgi:hypothetical protein
MAKKLLCSNESIDTGSTVYKNQYCSVDNISQMHSVVVHKFNLGDVEDPDLWAGEPLMNWEQSESGKWVMKHALEVPIWHRHPDPHNYGYVYTVTAELSGKDYTYWTLRWADTVDKKPR